MASFFVFSFVFNSIGLLLLQFFLSLLTTLKQSHNRVLKTEGVLKAVWDLELPSRINLFMIESVLILPFCGAVQQDICF